MGCFQENLSIQTLEHNQIVDITDRIENIQKNSGVRCGVCIVYTPHATAAMMINESADSHVGTDFLHALSKMVPEHGGWLHDRIDNNSAAHIKSALVGASVSVPISDEKLALGTWQKIFFCEFDGPRHYRTVLVSIIE